VINSSVSYRAVSNIPSSKPSVEPNSLLLDAATIVMSNNTILVAHGVEM
jgi:hypothetical protein